MGRKKPSGRSGDDEQLPVESLGGAKSKKKALVIDDDEYSVGTELSEEPKAEEDKVIITGKKKGKKGNKKGPQQEDDDIADKLGEEREEFPEIGFAGKKKSKSKKGGGATGFSSSNFALLDEEEEEDDVKGTEGKDEPATGFVGKKQMSKEGGSSFALTSDALGDGDDEGDEYNVMDKSVKSDSCSDVEAVAFTGKKKSSKAAKKSGSVFSAISFDEDNEELHGDEEEDESAKSVFTFSGKKKKASKKGKKGGSTITSSAFDALGNDDNDNEGEVMDKSVGSTFNEVNEDDEDDTSAITFFGKKKKSSKSSKKSGNSFSAALLDDENDAEVSTTNAGDDTVEDGDTSEITFSGRKKSSKKKGSTAFKTLNDESELGRGVADETKHDKVDAEPSKVDISDSKSNINKSEEVVETSKSKKKKKNKSGRTAQEEDDLDNILAELGEAPAVLKPTAPSPEEEKVQAQPQPIAPTDAAGEKEGEEETVESAAAKKKKKKKEKEKEKKAAAAAAAAASVETKEEKQEESVTDPSQPKKKDAKSKAVEKKIPKHVREMQEALARRQEAEERKKREEEERLRKEEEERRRQEELEKQAEEARRRKKEREKEKLLKKKQEGKLLTAKQKEEALRREAFKNHLMASAGGLPVPDKERAPTKRPIYGTKKKPAHQKTNGVASVQGEGDVGPKENQAEEPETLAKVDSVETERTEEAEPAKIEEKSEVADIAQENGVEEDECEDDWDSKSWDDVNLNIKGAFDDEEADSKAQPVFKKESNSTAPTARDSAAKPVVAPQPTTAAKKAMASQPEKDAENRKSQPELEDTSRRKDTATKGKMSASSDDVAKQSEENLRSPICCIMGHVDTGKTKLLDCIRGTNVQEGEAGGITQQIGATYFPAQNIRERTKELKADAKLKVPGLLVIDTPGHESFTNLRSRGSGLCDIAILVVDIMHGLEPQTIESLNLLKMRNTEFIVALNKVDRLYGWKTLRNAPIIKAIKQQSKDVINEFNMRLTGVITQFKEQGLNTELYYKNKEMGQTFSIVPTSAISGEGIPDLLLLLVQWAQKTMVEKLTYINKLQCTVLEVKVVEGHGTTIDVVLVNGALHEGDQIVVCGLQGPIVTTIRALLTPHPMKELRVKGTYLHHKEIKAAQGIKISAQGLENAIAGTGLYVVGPEDDLEEIKESAMEDMRSVMSRIDRSGEGVYVQASTLGSLEALLEFLKSPDVKIPVSGIGIGPVHKKDIMKASVMLERKKEFATILAFDVKVTTEARELADEMGVKIFCADIIYHLFDQFKAYIENIKEEKKKEAADEAVFPCVLRILPNCVFNKRDPIVLGVDVVEGLVKIGTPICIPQREFIDIGRIASIENNHKPVDMAKKGQMVAIKIAGSNPEEQQKMFGRHFDMEDELVSHISRKSIDILKANYRDELSIEEWKLVVKLKNIFKIQ